MTHADTTMVVGTPPGRVETPASSVVYPEHTVKFTWAERPNERGLRYPEATYQRNVVRSDAEYCAKCQWDMNRGTHAGPVLTGVYIMTGGAWQPYSGPVTTER